MKGRLMAIIRSIAAGIMVALSAWGCQRIELYELSTEVELELNLNLDIALDLNMAVETDVESEFPHIFRTAMPEYMEALFYNAQTNKLENSFIIGAEGGKVSVSPGDYNIVIYNIDTESTQVEGTVDQKDINAFTTDITKSMQGLFKAAVSNSKGTSTKGETKGYEDDPIIYEPDHLFVANEQSINVPSFEDRDKSITIHATASTILDIYSLEIIGVKGTENIEKVEAFITGQIKSNYIGVEKRSEDPATLYVESMKVDKTNNRLYTVFGTFGKLPGADNHIYLDITVTNTGGGQYRYVYDVTDQFEDHEDLNNRLVIYDEIEIPEGGTGGGGLAPEIDDWDEETVEVPLG